jgi:carbonic anhydrase
MKKILYSFKDDFCFSEKLAIFCSDERFVRANFEFLNNYLKIKRSDLIVLPGGPEFIVNDRSNLLDHLKILVSAHQIKEVVLISHSDCGYYNISLDNSSKEEILKKQLNDVQKAIYKLKKLFINMKVRGFHASLGDSRIIEYTQIHLD